MIAIENVRLFDETQRLLKDTQQRNAELAIINAVQLALAAELDLHGIYNAVGEKLREIFDAQTISIYSASFKQRMTTVDYSFEKGQKFDTITVPFNSLHESIIKSDETLLRNGDFPQYAAQFKDYKVPAGEIPLSVMSTTVYRNKEADIWVGVSIQDMDGIRTFDDSDVRLLETVAGAMSVALQNAQSFKAEQERVAELQIINSIQQGLASKLDFPSIIDLVGEQVRATMKAQSIFIALYDKSSDLVSWPYWVTNGERVPDSIEPLRKNITRRVLFATAPLNLGTEGEILAHDAIPPEKFTTVGKSFLGVPFSVGDAMLGALSIHALEQEHAFSESDARLLQTLANSMSVALENARLFDETQRLLKETEQRNAELAIINSVQGALAENWISRRSMMSWATKFNRSSTRNRSHHEL